MNRTLLLVLTTLHLAAGAVAAHRGDRILLIPELTGADLQAVDIHDGSVDEWQALLGEPVLTDADFELVSPDGPAQQTMHFRMWLAWHGATSRLYVAVMSVDDVFVNGFTAAGIFSRWENRFHPNIEAHDSYVGIGLDGNHSGDDAYQAGAALDQRGAQAYDVIGVTRGSPYNVVMDRENYQDLPFAMSPPYSDAGGRSVSEQPVVTVTEAYVTAFDDLHLDVPEESRRSDLRAGRVIGLALRVVDADAVWEDDLPDVYYLPGKWGFHYIATHGANTDLMNSGFFADALLLPARSAQGTGVDSLQADSWARIKASLSMYQDRESEP